MESLDNNKERGLNGKIRENRRYSGRLPKTSYYCYRKG